MNKTIGLKTQAMQKKIAVLKSIEREIYEDAKISSLKFGTNSSYKSSGKSSDEMQKLNLEYANVAVSLAELVNTTTKFLEKTVTAIEEADNASQGKAKKASQQKGG